MEAEDKLEELKVFLGYFFENHMAHRPVPPEVHPLNVLEELNRRSPSKARQGLRIAVNDCIEMAAMWPLEKVSTVDGELRARGIVTLSEVRRRHSKRFKAILKRGRINTEVEYYLLRGIVDGTDMSSQEAEKLRGLLNDFDRRTVVR